MVSYAAADPSPDPHLVLHICTPTEGDTHAFFRAFDECIAIQRELTFYLRIKPSDRRDTSSRLVELKANPCYTPGTTECLCVFAVLAPYPSAAVRDLDDFLALRIENERLNLQLEVCGLLSLLMPSADRSSGSS